MIAGSILTTIGEAVFPILEKAVTFYAGLPWWARLLALAIAAALAVVAELFQSVFKEETRGVMTSRRLIRYLGCLLPGWYVLRRFPLDTLAEIHPEAVVLGLFILGILMLWVLFTGHFWRILQIVLILRSLTLKTSPPCQQICSFTWVVVFGVL